MDEFKLRDDDTMRRLRTISQTPGEFAWRVELLSTIERMRVQTEVSMRAIIQNQTRLERQISHLTPTKLATMVNTQIEEKLGPRDKDINRLWKASMWMLDKLGTVAIGVICTLLGLKAMHP